MSKICLSSISKSFAGKVILHNVSLCFPEKGFFAICGKSGCGKSTLLNIIAGIEKPESGTIQIASKFKTNPGYIFQYYNLLEYETTLLNVMLPLLIQGKNHKEAETEASAILQKIRISKDLFFLKTNKLSGGEKQRVAIARAIMSNSSILLADEPTGALDSKNSEIIMTLLREISTESLVIIVSHNNELIDRFVDKKYILNDGYLVEDYIQENVSIKSLENKSSSKWTNYIFRSNIIKRKKRSIFNTICLCFSLTFSLLSLGFTIGKNNSILHSSVRQIDLGNVITSGTTNQKIEGSNISITHLYRPDISSLLDMTKDIDITYGNNYDALLSNSFLVSDNKKIKDFNLTPIYDFASVDSSLIKDGVFPNDNNFRNVVINEVFSRIFSVDVNDILRLKINYLNIIDSSNDYFGYIDDELKIDIDIKISAICDDFSFLSTPTIYYSYLGFEYELEHIIMENYSKFEGYEISWFDYIDTAYKNDQITSYSYRAFIDNPSYIILENLVSLSDDDLIFESNSYSRISSLISLTDAFTYGFNIFALISFIGAMLILGIMAFSSYTEDRRDRAILYVLGGKQNDISKIYLKENVLIVCISIVLSIMLFILLSLLINYIVSIQMNLKNIIALNPLVFIFLALISIAITFIFVLIPRRSERKISAAEVLKEE